MANRLKMAKIDAILHFHEQKWPKRRIARELGVHRDPVARVIRTAEQVCPQAGFLGQNRPPEPGALTAQNRPPDEGAPPSKKAGKK